MGAVISALLFQPPRPPSYSENDSRIIWLRCKGRGGKDPQTNKDVQVEIPSVYLSYKGSDLVLLYSHGNATDLGQMMPYLELLRSSLKINVFSYEYQGYGVSRPRVKSTEQRCYDSIEAAVDYLVTVKKHQRNKIIVFGTSLGSGPSIYIAAKYSRFVRGNKQALASIGAAATSPAASSASASAEQSASSSGSSFLTSSHSSSSFRNVKAAAAAEQQSSSGAQQQDHETRRRKHKSEAGLSATAAAGQQSQQQQSPQPLQRGRSTSTGARASLGASELPASDQAAAAQNGSDESAASAASAAAQLDDDYGLLDDNGEPFDGFRGVILQSPFTSVIKIKVKNAPKFMDMFLNIEKMDKIDCPVFIVHGKVDEVVPFEHALLLKEKARYPYKPLFIDYAGHNNIMDILSVERYIKKIFEFIVYLNAEHQKKAERVEALRKRLASHAGAASPVVSSLPSIGSSSS